MFELKLLILQKKIRRAARERRPLYAATSTGTPNRTDPTLLLDERERVRLVPSKDVVSSDFSHKMI
jgi:hypothetical protein